MMRDNKIRRKETMKIIIAPDSFKGSCSAVEAASSIERGLKKVFCDCETVKIPIADGGEGTVDALILSAGGEIREREGLGPLGRGTVKARYGIITREEGARKRKVGVVELAAASGLTLVPEDLRNPLNTTTYGTGQLILDAIDEDCETIVVGLGGSATNDGGLGIAQAFGVSFQDAEGNELGSGGGQLGKLACIDTEKLDKRLKDVELIIACDVKNPLCGPQGASFVYGPQKGGSPESLKILDANLEHYAGVISRQIGVDVQSIPGSGAAGGAGIPMLIFAGARIEPEIDVVLDITQMECHLQDADLVVTGEGRIDGQSIFGKVPVGVAARAKKHGLPVLVITGGIGDGAEACYEYGIDGMMSIVSGPMELEEAMRRAEELLESAAERAARMIRLEMGVNFKKYSLKTR